jgi:hypothetical protein
MKKPALIEITVRPSPDKESEATTAAPFTREGSINTPLSYITLSKAKSVSSVRSSRRTSIRTSRVSKSWKKQARQLKQNPYFDPWRKGILRV